MHSGLRPCYTIPTDVSSSFSPIYLCFSTLASSFTYVLLKSELIWEFSCNLIDFCKCPFIFFHTWAILGTTFPSRLFVPGLLPTFYLNLKKKRKKRKEICLQIIGYIADCTNVLKNFLWVKKNTHDEFFLNMNFGIKLI